MANIKDTANHPAETTYDVLVPACSARARNVKLNQALVELRRMRSENPDCILVAHLPNGVRVVGCSGSWERLDGSVE
jgi:hypothetical protein